MILTLFSLYIYVPVFRLFLLDHQALRNLSIQEVISLSLLRR